MGAISCPKPDDLSVIPGTHEMEGENRLTQVVAWHPHMCVFMFIHPLSTDEYTSKCSHFFKKGFSSPVSSQLAPSSCWPCVLKLLALDTGALLHSLLSLLSDTGESFALSRPFLRVGVGRRLMVGAKRSEPVCAT